MKPYSERTRQILEDAAAIAKEMGHSYIGSEHMLIAMAKDQQSIGGAALKRLRVSPYVIEKTVRNMLNEATP
jgi:ATP-dependent Clp protease ATP-binding subunit ClpC